MSDSILWRYRAKQGMVHDELKIPDNKNLKGICEKFIIARYIWDSWVETFSIRMRSSKYTSLWPDFLSILNYRDSPGNSRLRLHFIVVPHASSTKNETNFVETGYYSKSKTGVVINKNAKKDYRQLNFEIFSKLKNLDFKRSRIWFLISKSVSDNDVMILFYRLVNYQGWR